MKKLIEYSAIVYALLIFIGYSYLDIYYSLFGIPIHSFLDASEILLAFLNNINIIGFSISIIGLAYFIPIIFLKQYEKKESEKSQPIKEKTEEDVKAKRIASFIQMLIMLTCVVISGYQLISLIVKELLVSTIAIIYLLFIGVSTYIVWKLPRFLDQIKFKGNRSIQQIALAIVCICAFNYIAAIASYNMTKNKKDEVKLSFTYESKEYSSNDTLIYIGSLNNYIFLKNISSERNYIFEKDKITNLTMLNTKTTLP